MSYTFTAAEQDQILAALANCSGLTWDGERYERVPTAGTNAVPLYQTLSTIIAQKLQNSSNLDSQTAKDLKSAKLWLDVAIGAKSGEGMHSEFIRTYTNIQGKLRLGRTFTPAEMQAASNAVARNVANSLLLGDSGADLPPWTVPSISQIAGLDASAVGETLFRDKLSSNSDTAITRNAAWSGTFGFNLLGGGDPFESWRLMTAGDTGSELDGQHQLAKPNALDDFKNVLFAAYAYDKAVRAGFAQGGIDFLKALARLDQRLDFIRLNVLLEASSNMTEASLKGIFDGLRKMLVDDPIAETLIGDALESTSSRTAFHERFREMRENAHFQTLEGCIRIFAVPANSPVTRDDFSALFILAHLTPFTLQSGDSAASAMLHSAQAALGTKWVEERDLSAEERIEGKAHFSDAYLAGGAAMPCRIVERNNQKEASAVVNENHWRAAA